MPTAAPTSTLPLTEEQRRAVDLVAAGGDGAVVARAGSGKTHTLRAVAEATAPRPATLLAFNRAIARDAAGRFPAHVRVTTLHAFAYRSVIGGDARLRRKFSRDDGRSAHDVWTDLVGVLRADPAHREHVAAVRALLRGFCASDDPLPRTDHLPAALRARLADALGPDRATERERWLARRAARAWERIADADDPAPIDHDGYLKLFALERRVLPGSLLLVDEAQDLAPVMLAIVDRQEAARLLVGDPAQRIYGWRGAVDAMAASGYPEVRLTRSFRFGPEIAEAARNVLRVLAPGAALDGAGPAGHVVDTPMDDASPRTVLCRSNAGVIEAAVALGGRGVHVVGGLGSMLASLRCAHRLWRERDRVAPRRTRGGGRTSRAEAPRERGTTPDELAGIDRWDTLVQAAEMHGGPLRTLQRLIDAHGERVPEICDALARCERREERDAPLILSTVHRAKGREWDRVEAWHDLPRVPDDADALARAPDPDAARAELNLLYVAVTRARHELGIGHLREDLRSLLSDASS